MSKVESIRELRKICQPTQKDVYQIFRDRLYRKMSIYLTKFFLYTPITANGVSFIMILSGIFSAILYMKGEYFYSLAAIFMFQLYVLLDFTDGEVARYKKQFSKRGAYLDLMSHIIINPLLIMGMAVGAYFNNPLPIPNFTFLIAGFLGVYSLLMINFMTLKKYEMCIVKKEKKVFEKMGQVMSKRWAGEETGKKSFFNIKAKISSFVGFRHFNLMFYMTIFNLIPFLVLFNGILFPISGVIKFYHEYKYIDEI